MPPQIEDNDKHAEDDWRNCRKQSNSALRQRREYSEESTHKESHQEGSRQYYPNGPVEIRRCEISHPDSPIIPNSPHPSPAYRH